MASPTIQFKRGNLSNLPGLQAGEPAFTLDTFDLFVGFTSESSTNKFFGSHRYWSKETNSLGSGVNLVEGLSNGGSYISLRSPNSLAGIVTYYFPGNQGSSNTLLQNDGSGNLSWSSTVSNLNLSGINTIGGKLDITADILASGISTFSNTTNNTLGDENTGAVQIAGGLGIAKNLTVKENLYVGGESEFVGIVTFKGGTINLGDGNTDNINVGGEFISNLTPNTDDTYDLGIGTQRWRNANFSGVGTFSHFDVLGDLNVTGNVTVGGTTVTLLGQDVYIQNKDIILGYTTSITPNDDTANHAGVAIASTEGTPLVSFSVSGINTLPDTYKQMMWFKEGTLGFATDMFGFNYGLAIGTTTVANGVRLAVGSDVRVTDTNITTPFLNVTTDAIVGTSLSSPTIKVETIQHSNSTQAATIDSAGNITASQNLTVSGNLYVNGSTTQLNAESVTIEDRTIELGIVDGTPPTSQTTWDLGILFNYFDDSAKRSGLVWEQTSARFKLGSVLSDSGGTGVNNPQITFTTYSPIEVSELWINNTCTGGSSKIISCSAGNLVLENIIIDGGSF